MVAITGRRRASAASPTKPSASEAGSRVSGVIKKQSMSVAIGDIPADDVIVIGIENSQKLYGVAMDDAIEALSPYSVYVAIKNKPDLKLADFGKDNVLQFDYNITTHDDGELSKSLKREFTALQREPTIKIGLDWYGYKLSNIRTNTYKRAPFKALEQQDNQVYTGSLLKRLTAVLDRAGLKTEAYDLSGLTGDLIKRDRDTYSLQENCSYWDMIKAWMAKASFTCFLDQEGKLRFVDSIDKFPEAEKTLVGGIQNLNANQRPEFQQSELFNVRFYDEADAEMSVKVQGIAPANASQRISGQAGKSTIVHNVFTGDATTDQANQTAKALLGPLNWDKHIITAETRSVPPSVGYVYTLDYYDADGKKQVHKVMPVKLELALTNFRDNQSHEYAALSQWTGMGAEARAIKITFVKVEPGYLPAPIMVPADFNNNTVTYGVTVDANGNTKGKTASKGNKIALILKMENVDSKPTVIYAHVLKPFAFTSALPPAGTLVFVRLDAFGNAFCEAAVQQIELGQQTEIQATEGDQKQAKIVIGHDNVLTSTDGSKTSVNVTASAVETSVAGGKTKLVYGDEVEITSKGVTLNLAKSFVVKTQKIAMDASDFAVKAMKALINTFKA